MKNQGWLAEKPGYTLVELMIVLVIIVVFAAIAMASMVRQQDQQLFNNQFESILSMINNARSQAITGKGQLDYTDFDHDGCQALDCTDFVTPANYGVHFDSKMDPSTENVVMFADMNPTEAHPEYKGTYNPEPAAALTEGGDLKLGNIINLGTDFCLRIEDNNPPSANSSGSIFFSPNYADISFEGYQVTSDKPFLLIRLHDNTAANRCKQIRIHQLAGIPEVEQCTVTTESCSSSP